MLASKAKRDAKVWRLHWWWAGGGWSQFDRARDSSCEIVNYEIVLHTTDNEINNSEWKVSVLVQQPSPAQFRGVLPVKPVSNLTQLLTSRKQAADVDVCETCTNVDVWESWNVRVRSESHTGPSCPAWCRRTPLGEVDFNKITCLSLCSLDIVAAS